MENQTFSKEWLTQHLERSVEELELSVSSTSKLKDLKIRTIRELARQDIRYLFSVLKRRSFMEITEVLGEMGLCLGMSLTGDILEEVSRLTKEQSDQIRFLMQRKQYPEPDIPLSAGDFNAALGTTHGKRIVALLSPFREQPLDLKPPIKGLEKKVKIALEGLGEDCPMWVISIHDRIQQVKKYKRQFARYEKEIKQWREFKKQKSMNHSPRPSQPVCEYMAFNFGGWGGGMRALTRRDFPKMRHDESTGISFLARIHYLLKERDQVWHKLQESLKTFQGGGLDLGIQVVALRNVVMEMLGITAGLIAEGDFESAQKVKRFLQLAGAGNVPYGIADKHGITDKHEPNEHGFPFLKFFVVFTA